MNEAKDTNAPSEDSSTLERSEPKKKWWQFWKSGSRTDTSPAMRRWKGRAQITGLDFDGDSGELRVTVGRIVFTWPVYNSDNDKPIMFVMALIRQLFQKHSITLNEADHAMLQAFLEKELGFVFPADYDYRCWTLQHRLAPARWGLAATMTASLAVALLALFLGLYFTKTWPFHRTRPVEPDNQPSQSNDLLVGRLEPSQGALPDLLAREAAKANEKKRVLLAFVRPESCPQCDEFEKYCRDPEVAALFHNRFEIVILVREQWADQLNSVLIAPGLTTCAWHVTTEGKASGTREPAGFPPQADRRTSQQYVQVLASLVTRIEQREAADARARWEVSLPDNTGWAEGYQVFFKLRFTEKPGSVLGLVYCRKGATISGGPPGIGPPPRQELTAQTLEQMIRDCLNAASHDYGKPYNCRRFTDSRGEPVDVVFYILRENETLNDGKVFAIIESPDQADPVVENKPIPERPFAAVVAEFEYKKNRGFQLRHFLTPLVELRPPPTPRP